MPESPLDPDLELIDVATRLIAARTDDRFHTTAAAARAGDGRILTSPGGRCRQVLLDLFPQIRVVVWTGSAAQAVRIDELLPWANPWDRATGSTPVQDRPSGASKAPFIANCGGALAGALVTPGSFP